MGTAERNPVMDYYQHIVFPLTPKVSIKRKESDGGDVVYENYDAFSKDYIAGLLHPKDIKQALAARINELLQPVRDHFESSGQAKDILKRVKKFKVSR